MGELSKKYDYYGVQALLLLKLTSKVKGFMGFMTVFSYLLCSSGPFSWCPPLSPPNNTTRISCCLKYGDLKRRSFREQGTGKSVPQGSQATEGWA